MIFANQEQFFNDMNIYDIDHDLRLFIDDELKEKILISLNVFRKKFGDKSFFKNGTTMNAELIKLVDDILKRNGLGEENEDDIEEYIRYLIES